MSGSELQTLLVKDFSSVFNVVCSDHCNDKHFCNIRNRTRTSIGAHIRIYANNSNITRNQYQ